MFPLLLAAITAVLVSHCSGLRLSVSGEDLMYGTDKVYLSGANAAWNEYGYDFGNGFYDGTLEDWVADLGAAGGNTMRVWAHVEGFNTPAFDPSSGLVTACDNTGHFVNDVITFLDAAQASDVFIIFVLWNGAKITNQVYYDMILDDAKFQSYLDNCLTSLVEAVAGHPALGAWEAVNEAEGAIQIAADENPCYDTTLIGEWGADWTGVQVPMERFLRFIGRINQVIRELDPTGAVTISSWAQHSLSDAFYNTKNHYTDECLEGAAGGPGAGADFYQIHTYDKDWGGVWSDNAPFTVNASDYAIGRPIAIGEFSSLCAANTSLEDLHEYAYTRGYVGSWTWRWAGVGVECVESMDHQRAGLAVLANRTDHGLVNVDVR